MSEELKTGEVKTEEVKIEVKAEPTPEEKAMLESGADPREVEMAKKHGLIKTEKMEEAKETEQKDESAKLEEEREAIRKKPFEQITEEDSKKLTKNEQGYYWAQKKYRMRAQSAETERDYYIMQLQAQKDRLDKLEKTIAAKGKETDEDSEIRKILEDEGKATEKKIEETDEKLTAAEWQAKEEAAKKEKEVLANRVNSRLNEFEIEAKQKYEDFDEIIGLATEIFEKAKTNNLKELGFDDERSKSVFEQCRAWVMKAANILDKNTPNLSEIAYEIGKQHPKYGKKEVKAEINGEKLSDDKLKKLTEQKPKTSASVSGAGGGVLPVSEMTIEQARNLKMSEWRKLSKDQRERLLGKPT